MYTIPKTKCLFLPIHHWFIHVGNQNHSSKWFTSMSWRMVNSEFMKEKISSNSQKNMFWFSYFMAKQTREDHLTISIVSLVLGIFFIPRSMSWIIIHILIKKNLHFTSITIFWAKSKCRLLLCLWGNLPLTDANKTNANQMVKIFKFVWRRY